MERNLIRERTMVSTHSHPKVAAYTAKVQASDLSGFNTQPPEGGCTILITGKWW